MCVTLTEAHHELLEGDYYSEGFLRSKLPLADLGDAHAVIWAAGCGSDTYER